MNEFEPSQIMARDAFSLERASQRKKLSPKEAAKFRASSEAVKRRRARVPRIEYQTDLPIRTTLPEIEKVLITNQVLVVAGETGSGKTTQIPLACLKSGLGVRGMIGHTQPRRLAARSVADRIATELGVPLGGEVGFAVRFEDRVSPDTLVKVVTDGLLLTEIRRDRFLNAYDTIIVDEAHERSLNIDFLLGYLKTLLGKRKDLRVIVTSATIDVKAFSEYFDDAPVLHVEGRSYPVDIRYRPIEVEIEDTVRECVEEIGRESPSGVQDILMFLPGEREIFEWSQWFRKNYPGKFEILPLYARLPPKEQRKIFEQSGEQRVLLATNVAETSLTVPNIRYVVDVGDARISRFSLQSRIQRLPIEPISQASANQRAGRCGRVAPGICFRLYDEYDFARRREYSIPEIRRTNLASVVLQMLVLRFGDIETFPFLDPPEGRAISSAKRLLQELGAIQDESLTPVGNQMASLPVDPRLARMLIEANVQNALKEVLIIVAALAAQDPRLRPLDRRQAADRAHQKFFHESSDFLTFVSLWNWAETERQNRSRRAFRRVLESMFVSPSRYQEWRSLHRQLRLACIRLGMRFNSSDASPDQVHQSVLSGSLSFVGLRTDDVTYVGQRDLKFRLFPGSNLSKRKPKWIVSAEITETTQTYARCLAPIKPSWIEKYAEPLLNHRAHDPYWDPKRGKSMVFLDMSLAGLPVVQNRRVGFVNYDALGARHFFVKHALVRRHSRVDVPEIAANAKLVAALREIQDRERRLDVVADENRLSDFYLRRIPEHVYDVDTFKKWYASSEKSLRDKLKMSPEDILLEEQVHLRADAFPSELNVAGCKFPLKYRFSPGDVDDGVTVQVPMSELSSLNEDLLEWLVPGFMESKCLDLLRILPKQVRKRLAPIPDRVKEILPELLQENQYRQGSLLNAMAAKVREFFRIEIDPSLWDTSKLDSHLHMNIQVLDKRGRVLEQGRDLSNICQRTADVVQTHLGTLDTSDFEQIGIRSFPKAGIPWSQTLTTPSGSVVAYTRIVDRLTSVDIVLTHEPGEPLDHSLRGLCRLVSFAENQSVKYLVSMFDQDREMQMHWVTVGKVSDLRDALVLKAISRVYFREEALPSRFEDFNRLLADNRGRLVEVGMDLLDLVKDILNKRHRIVVGLEQLKSKAYDQAKNDLLKQIRAIVPDTFPFSMDFERLRDVPRYLNGMETRLHGLPGKVSRDNSLMLEVAEWDERLLQLQEQGCATKSIEQLFHLIQEYRISLFCQTMKTRLRISRKRLEEEFVRVEQGRPSRKRILE